MTQIYTNFLENEIEFMRLKLLEFMYYNKICFNTELFYYIVFKFIIEKSAFFLNKEKSVVIFKDTF